MISCELLGSHVYVPPPMSLRGLCPLLQNGQKQVGFIPEVYSGYVNRWTVCWQRQAIQLDFVDNYG